MGSKTSLVIFILLIAVIIQVQTAYGPRRSSFYYARVRAYFARTPRYKLLRLVRLLREIRDLVRMFFFGDNSRRPYPPQLPAPPPAVTVTPRTILNINDNVRVTYSSSETKISHSPQCSNINVKTHSYSITPRPAVRKTLQRPPVKATIHPEQDNQPDILDLLFGPEAK